MLKLIIEDDEGKTTVVPLIRDEISIGRKEGNTIRLTERNVSRRHAKLMRQNGAILLEDLDSYNGTKVNGSRINGQVTINEGDRIQIGDYQLALKQEGPKADGGGAAPSTPFDEMKTVPVEKAQAQAMAMHLAATAPGAAAPSVAPGDAIPAAAADDQPTQRLEADATPGQMGRLVVISSNFAGKEFQLDKAAQVIGRTPDNDIVVDHRSISRHHAKIVRQGAGYTIVDQVSSNGVYVNGEKYDRIELRAGDVVDLGHVRIRYVAPGETYRFDPSAIDDLSPTDSKMGLYVAIGIGVVLVIAVIILIATGAFSGNKKAGSSSGGGGDGEMSGDPGAMKPAMTAGAPAAREYEAIKTALAQKDWGKASYLCNRLLIDHPGDAEAQRLKSKAAEERENEKHFKAFKAAIAKGDRSKAVFEGSQVGTASVYYPELSKRLGAEKQRLAKQLLRDAKRFSRAGKCDALRDLATKYAQVAPDDNKVKDLVGSCKSKGEPTEAMPPDTGPRPTPRPAGMQSAAEVARQARQAWVSGQCAKAIKLAKKANRLKYSARNTVIIGICACKLRRQSAAKSAYRRLSGGSRSTLVQLCRAKGIALE